MAVRIGDIYLAAMRMSANLGRQSAIMDRAIERIATGQRINRAADDPAGLAIREKMRGQIRGMRQAKTNAQDGISLLQTAEASLAETTSMLHRIKELVVQASNGTLTPQDRLAIQKEIDQLTQEIDRIAGATEFNTMPLLRGRIVLSGNTLSGGGGGTAAFGQIKFLDHVQPGDRITIGGQEYTFGDGQGGTVAIGATPSQTAQNLAVAINGRGDSAVTADATFETMTIRAKATGAAGNTISLAYQAADDGFNLRLQVGANAGQTIEVTIHNMDSGSLGIGFAADDTLAAPGQNAQRGIDVTTPEAAERAQVLVDQALAKVSSERGTLGAYMNRLEHTINYLGTAVENLSAAEARISDADIAEETAAFAKAQLLIQAATAFMAQAQKIRADAILKLLGA